MATLGVARINNINSGSTDPTKCDIQLYVVGLKSGSPVGAHTVLLTDMDMTITNLTWESALKQAARDDLINNYGYTFGLLDVVRLVGETLI